MSRRIFVFLVLLSITGGVFVVSRLVQAQTEPGRATCIGFQAPAQIASRTATLAEEWMNQQISGGRTRFLALPRESGWVLCAW